MAAVGQAVPEGAVQPGAGVVEAKAGVGEAAPRVAGQPVAEVGKRNLGVAGVGNAALAGLAGGQGAKIGGVVGQGLRPEPLGPDDLRAVEVVDVEPAERRVPAPAMDVPSARAAHLSGRIVVVALRLADGAALRALAEREGVGRQARMGGGRRGETEGQRERRRRRIDRRRHDRERDLAPHLPGRRRAPAEPHGPRRLAHPQQRMDGRGHHEVAHDHDGRHVRERGAEAGGGHGADIVGAGERGRQWRSASPGSRVASSRRSPSDQGASSAPAGTAASRQ